MIFLESFIFCRFLIIFQRKKYLLNFLLQELTLQEDLTDLDLSQAVSLLPAVDDYEGMEFDALFSEVSDVTQQSSKQQSWRASSPEQLLCRVVQGQGDPACPSNISMETNKETITTNGGQRWST